MDSEKIITTEKMIKKLQEVADKLEKRKSEIIAEIPSVVKEWGHSAHITFQKKFIGHPVDVIVKKKPKEIEET